MFEKTDTNKDGKIQISELKELTVEFWNFGRMKCDINELAKAFLEDFDGDKDGELIENEFAEGIARLLKQYKFNFDLLEDQRENQIVSIEISQILYIGLGDKGKFCQSGKNNSNKTQIASNVFTLLHHVKFHGFTTQNLLAISTLVHMSYISLKLFI